jgi:hypothetical protein
MSNIDLNIDNYNISELVSFFNLNPNYSVSDLDKKEKEKTLSILSAKNNVFDATKKYDFIEFIKKAKDVLLNLKNNAGDSKDSKDSKDNKDSEDNINIGQIINPMSNFPSMQFSKNAIEVNGYTGSTVIRNYVFNTKYRDNYAATISTNSSFEMSQKMVNVTQIDLSALQFPNFAFTFSDARGTNKIYIEEDITGNSAIVTIPSGNYDYFNFPEIFTKIINEQVVGVYNPDGPNRFEVSISPTTFFTEITNSTYTFSMYTIIPKNQDEYTCPNNYTTRYFKTNIQPKTGLRPEQYFNTLGWLMGYRSLVYTGFKSYISEGHFSSVAFNYIYFVLDDFVNNQMATTYAVLAGSILDNNILAVIPISSQYFTNTFDNNSNFLYKTRNYTGPVNISKINIRLLNDLGEEINLHNSDFSFCLQVTSLFDPIKFSV